ncbi:calcium-activated chloride channel-domain-containing protein [Sporodiniella umbellata]|nr:calcium-activated chloride channel-domain-containing protein [Sporodiniella umbellata]
MTEKAALLSNHGPKEFSHLFPLAQEQVLKPNSSKMVLDKNAGVDYVIHFKYPVNLKSKGKKKDVLSKKELEQKVTESINSITMRLASVGLRYQIRPGKEPTSLLLLISCPLQSLKKAYRQERVRDFLLGVRVDDIDDVSDIQTFQELTESERLRLVYEIITHPKEEGGAGISTETDEYIEAILPLHNDEFNHKWITSWSTKWLITENDLLSIRNHFGEKIAYYFAFLQNYFLWLSVPSVLGIFVHFTHSNTLALWYSIAMLLWALVFLEDWKRKEKDLAIQWGVRNYSKNQKRRAEFKGDTWTKDRVTGEDTPEVSVYRLLGRRLVALPGIAVGAVFLSLIVAFVFMLQLFLHEYYNGPFSQYLHYAPTVGYVLFIPKMISFYSKWMKTLNDWEMHKTNASYDYHYTQKIFIANFLVGYMSLFITAWLYIPFGDHVLPYLVQFNVSHEHKTVDFQRLRSQLVYFIVTGQVIGFITEMVVPFVLNKIKPKAQRVTEKVLHKEKTPNSKEMAEREANSEDELKFMQKVYNEVSLDEYNIFMDYAEMVIQFGYVSMFSTVWPLTSFFCMINNWVELRGDAVKVCKYTRRPVPARAESIGPWLGNLETLVWLSSITMSSFAYLFHPSTNIHSAYTPIFTLLAILISEHFYIALRTGVRYGFDVVLPHWSEWRVKREEYRLKKVWLERMVGDYNTFISIKEQAPDNDDISRGLSGKIWSKRLGYPDNELQTAVQHSNDAFFDDDYDEALDMFSQLVIREPDNPEYLLKRCSVYQKIDKLELALKDSESALRLLGQDSQNLLARAHLQTGIILHRQTQYQKAQQHLEESQKLNPNEKTLVTWLRKNTEKVKELEPAPQPTTNSVPNATARHEWFQNENFVTIEVFVKKIKQEDVTVDFFEGSLSFGVKLPTGSTYSIELDPLAHKIIPKESSYKVLSTKIEIKLKKEICGIMWGALESDNDLGIVAAATTEGRRQTKDWNKIVEADEEEKPSGDAAVNALFQQIYRDADPDTKRAMMKSFVESNGTCLSTNWADVGKKKVDTKPPEGTTVKKVMRTIRKIVF